MKQPSLLRLLGATAAFGAAAYGVYVGIAWLRYGHPRRARTGEADPLLDRFMPGYDVVERHSIHVDAPAEITLAAACDLDFEELRVVRAIFKGRELLLRARRGNDSLPRGLLAKMLALGWGKLAEVPDREIVMGAVTQPWEANAEFRRLTPQQFVSFQEPGYVKIAWTLRADPVTPEESIFRTETRVLACGPEARSKFRRYWAYLSPGIILIRLAMLGPLKRDAERRAREAARWPENRFATS